jgi:hypothetical protein
MHRNVHLLICTLAGAYGKVLCLMLGPALFPGHGGFACIIVVADWAWRWLACMLRLVFRGSTAVINCHE